MSGLSLYYPLKLQGVSDDLESFVNVIYFNTLRFCHHNFTNAAFWHADPKNDEDNEPLAKFVSTFFFDETRYKSVHGTLWTGGVNKQQVYGRPKLPFALTEPSSESMAAAVLQELHSACHMHYRFVNPDQLKQYLPPPPKLSEKESAPMEAETMNLIQAWKLRFSSNRNVFLPKPSHDPLANHTHLEHIFRSIMDDPDLWVRDDKTPDQFENLPSLTLIRDKGLSSLSPIASISSAASRGLSASHCTTPSTGRRCREDNKETQGGAPKKQRNTRTTSTAGGNAMDGASSATGRGGSPAGSGATRWQREKGKVLG